MSRLSRLLSGSNNEICNGIYNGIYEGGLEGGRAALGGLIDLRFLERLFEEAGVRQGNVGL